MPPVGFIEVAKYIFAISISPTKLVASFDLITG
jgi:hypothetical protein